MNKKLLIITSSFQKDTSWQQREEYIQEFADSIEERLRNVSIKFTTYAHLVYTVKNGVCNIYDRRNKLDLSDVDLVHFKNLFYEPEEAGLVASFLKSKKIKFFNDDADNGLAHSKIKQMFALAEGGVPVPDTFYARKQHLLEMFESGQLPESFELPLIMKANFGSKGDDNYLIKTFDEAVQILKKEEDSYKEFVLQNFIENDGDYRYLFIGLDAEPLIIHRTSAGDSHLNNTSKGGQGEFTDSASLPAEALSYARQAASLLRREIGGADVLIDKNSGNVYILEVNGTPALATGYGREEKAEKFAKFLEDHLRN